MADDSEAATNDELIEVTLKTPKQKHNFRVKPNISVKELKEKATKEFSATIEQLVLIFSGKILKDVDTIDQHSIKNGHVIHLVIKSSASKNSQQTDSSGNSSSTTAARSEPQQHQQPQQPTQAPGSMFGLGGLEGLSSLGLGTGDLRGMQQQMQRELMSNPEALSQIMDNPMVQSMMSNPELLQQLIMNNPQMQQLMERNPEITHMLNNPQLMRQTMELARNPAMLQEMMRNQDRAMSNLESIPGGYNALHRMYTEYQEPMLNAAQEQFGQNPFAGLVSNNQNSESQRQNTENTEPLPNPWAATGGGRTSTVTTTSSSTPKSCSGTQSTAGSNQTTPNASGMFGTPAMQDLMSQISSNPSLVQNMMNSPYVQNMMRNMTNNPDLSSQILLQNPMFANNPQMREMLPSMIEQMQRPEMQAAMSNPRALEAMMQVQAGLQTLQREAPGVLGFTGHPPTTSAPTMNNSSTPTTTGVTTPTPPNSAATMAMLNTMMRAGIITGGAGAGNPLGGATQEAPETRFRLELEQLSQMGFINQEANIRALQTTGGNINQAVELLLLNRDGR